MIILTSQLLFDKNGERILFSVVYDESIDRFLRTSQRISAELVQDLSSQNPVIDIYDVVSLDYQDQVLTDDEVKEVFEMVEDGPVDNEIIQKAVDFIKRYRRDKNIKNIINEKD
jgi:hypothetical protein